MMMIVLWITTILLILSFAGYMLLIRRTLGLPWEFIPVFVFSSVTVIVFFFGLAGQLWTGSLIVLVLGLLAFIAVLLLRTFKDWRLTPPSIYQVAFFAGSLLFLLVLFQNRLTHYDNFSHWAIVLKQMLSTDAFPEPDSLLIDFKNYPLGTTSFLYYVCRFAGHAQSVMLLAQGLLIFSCFYAMFGIISEKKRFLLVAFLGLGLSSLSIFNITIRITNLLVDFLLPIYALAMLSVIHHYRARINMACLVVLPLAGLLVIIKSTGIIFAAIALLYLVYVWLTSGNSRSILRRTPVVIATVCGSLLPYFGWSWRMKTVFQGVDNKFDVAATGLQTGKTPEQMSEIISLFISSATDLSTRPALGIAAFQIAAMLASVFAAYILKKKWSLWKALIALDLVVILYYAGILGLYLFSMPLDEAIVLAGFERYASSIVVLFAGGLVLCATVDIERSFHYKLGEVPQHRAFKSVRNKGYYQKGIWVCTAIAVALLLSEYNGMKSIANEYESTLPYKVYQVTGDRWMDGGQEDNSRYLFYSSDADMQVTNYYLQYVAKYYLFAPNVDGIVLFYEDNMDNLLSGYDYFVVVESDPGGNRLLKKHYGVEMTPGIYKITVSGKRVELALQ